MTTRDTIIIVAVLAVVAAVFAFFMIGITGGKSFVFMTPSGVTSDQITIILTPSAVACAGCFQNFEPQTAKVVIGVNNTVRWVNRGIMPAMIEADNDSDPHFYGVTKDFVFLKPGELFDFTFSKVGEFGYHGKPWQHGTVIVSK